MQHLVRSNSNTYAIYDINRDMRTYFTLLEQLEYEKFEIQLNIYATINDNILWDGGVIIYSAEIITNDLVQKELPELFV